jgi:hypothetical protein
MLLFASSLAIGSNDEKITKSLFVSNLFDCDLLIRISLNLSAIMSCLFESKLPKLSLNLAASS